MPLPVDSEAATVEREAQSVFGSVISQVIGIVRTLVNWTFEFIKKLYDWFGEHPEMALLSLVNLYILFGV